MIHNLISAENFTKQVGSESDFLIAEICSKFFLKKTRFLI